jgi:hypothetical protein
MSSSTLKTVGALFISILTLSPPLSTARTNAERKGLSVDGTVLSKKCLASNINLAEFRLRFEFTNSTSQPLILNKSDLEIETIKYFAFINEKTNNVHLGELAVDRLRGFLPEYDREIVGPHPNDHFVILRPRQSYAFETTESVPLIPTSAPNPAAEQSDEYQVEFELATWVNHAGPLADSLRRRWGRFGMLWTQSVWSEPVLFVFPRRRTCEP